MTLHKTRLLFVASLLVLSLVALSGSVHALMRVPDAECPKRLSDVLTLPHCQFVVAATQECWRSESSIYPINDGYSVTVWGKETLDCENCNGCPENTPPSKSCTRELAVSYTEVVTVTLANSNMQSANTISSQLNASIGHPSARTTTKSTLCRTESLAGCKMQSFSVSMQVTEGIEKEMNHGYQWRIALAHKHDGIPGYDDYNSLSWYVLWGCKTCQFHAYMVPTWRHVVAFSGSPSRVVGSSYDGAVATCEEGAVNDCP